MAHPSDPSNPHPARLSDIASVLYFPSIEFTDTTWLKASLLLWDCVYRIVPKGYEPSDAYPVRQATDAGCVKPIQLESDDFSRISAEFIAFVSGIRYKPAALDATRTERLHKDKVDGRLYPFLEKLALDLDLEGFFTVPRDFARFYMLYLAKAVAGRRRLACATDNRDAWTILPYFLERGNFAEKVYDEDAEGYYSGLVFQDLIPASIGTVPMERVLDFVQKHSSERILFRSTVHDFANTLSKCESVGTAKQTIEGFKSRIDTAKADFKKSMQFGNRDEVHSLFTVGLTTAASVYRAISDNNDDVYSMTAKAGTSVVLGAVAALTRFRSVIGERQKDSSVSYLVDVDRAIAERRAIPRYFQTFNEFMND